MTDMQALRDDERERKKQLFLQFFAEQGTIKKAAALAGVHRDTFYAWCQIDTSFNESFQNSVQDFHDSIRDEIHRRAIDEHNDKMLMFLARSRLPELRNQPIETLPTPAQFSEYSLTIEDIRLLDNETLDTLVESMQRLSKTVDADGQ